MSNPTPRRGRDPESCTTPDDLASSSQVSGETVSPTRFRRVGDRPQSPETASTGRLRSRTIVAVLLLLAALPSVWYAYHINTILVEMPIVAESEAGGRQAGASALAAKPTCSTREGLVVVSHKCSGMPGTDPNSPMWPSCLALAAHRVTVFDMDVFLSSDRVAFVGHPRDEGARVGVESVERESAATLVRHGVLPLTDLLAAIRSGVFPAQQVTLEPKFLLGTDFNELCTRT